MAEIVICDICEDSDALHPNTGRYVIVVKKFIESEKGVDTTQETEWDVCGVCMAKLRKEGLK